MCFQLENLTTFTKAITMYGLRPHDIFEANDLFESGNMTQVQTTLLALASMVSITGRSRPAHAGGFQPGISPGSGRRR